MKRIFVALVLLISFNFYSQAQTTPAKAKKTTAAKPAASATAPTKKDGTPDMRYKTNKDAAKATPATTHTKKDGTPDKRYKENKK
jgi:hypothetical protein